MSADESLPWKHLLARLAGTGALLALLLASALFLSLDSVRWSAFVLALSVALIGASAIFQISAARAKAQSLHPRAPYRPQIRQEREPGLPVHPTTGLYRPWIFRQRLIEEIARARRYKRNLALVLLEPADLLMEVSPNTYARAARVLRKSIRICDFAAHLDDRFAVLLPETGRMGAKVTGRRLISRLRSSSESNIRWRGSLVTYPEDATDPDILLQQALIALRRSQTEGPLGPTSEAAA